MKQELSPEHRVALIQYRFERAYKTLEEADYMRVGNYFNAAIKPVYPMLADVGTGHAADAASRLVHQLRCSKLRFRIMTPETANVAALQKNSGADPRTIVETEFLYIKNNTHISSQSRKQT